MFCAISAEHKLNMTCDIFCRVIDNFGDVGVTWRLARQLGNEFEITTRLFVDDLVSLAVLVPALDPLQSSQIVERVEVRGWPGDDITDITLAVADCVIEAFQCALPLRYVNAMTLRRVAPVWINLDYLSAESWVIAHHLLPSPHPQLALNKYFFFPGFEPGTGGLLRERDLFLKRDAALLTNPRRHSNELRVLIFGYANAALPELLNAIERMCVKTVKTFVTIPHSQLGGAATVWHDAKKLASADNLRINIQPFVSQSEFDSLLWSQDVCFVRGEDSFVRAQWGAKPFVWQIYPTSDGAHLRKLNAFLDRYCIGLQIEVAAAVRELWRAWNVEDGLAMSPAWLEFMRHRTVLNSHARAWADQLAKQPDLATNLVTFVAKSANIEGFTRKSVDK